MKYSDEAKNIWERYVPASGQSDTVQGELVRVVAKLASEAMRNGNGNWDHGFEMFVDYLQEHLLDRQVYTSATIEQTTAILQRLRRFEEVCLDKALYDQLFDRVVERFRFYGSQPNTPNPKLWR